MPTDKKISDLPVASSINTSDISILIDSGTDYQYTFTVLLQFLAANLTVGANISFGTLLPQNTTGANGDVFVNTSTGSFAQKLSGTWTVVYTLPSAGTADGTLLYGTGTPSSSTGKDTDSYINTLTGIFYKKASGTWSQVFSMATGPQGPQGAAGTNGTNGTNGNTVLFGNANPSNSTTGIDGDFYINTANYQFFGPKASGAWPSGVSIIGADGPQGVAGADGTNGQGVVAGGAAGQVLAKIDGTDYNTHWIDETGGGSTGYTDRTFNQAIIFDAPFKSVYNQTADITLSLSGTPVADVIGRITIVGDGTHALIFPASGSPSWFNVGGAPFDNTKRNIIYFEYTGAEILYSIECVATPDVTAPSLLSATISNLTPNQIVLSYSEPLDATSVPATSAFSVNLSKAVTAVAVSGSQVTVTVDSNYINGDSPTISYTAGGNPIQDPSHNQAANLSPQAVTNNVLPASTSMYITGSTQLPKTSVIPTGFAFGSGGTDTPFSLSVWVKWSTGDGVIAAIGPVSGTSYGFAFQIVSASVYFQILGAAGVAAQTYINSNTNLVTNTWTNVVVTYDGSKLNSGMKIYFNGSLIANTPGTNGTYGGQGTFAAGTVLSLLANPDGSSELNNCRLSSLYIWNKELTSGDVTAIYNGGHIVDPTTLGVAGNLIGQYDLSGNLNDAGSNHYNLTSSSAPTYIADVP